VRLGPIVLVVAVVVAGCGGGGGGAKTTTARTTSATTGTGAAPALSPASDCGEPSGFRCSALTVPLHRRGPRAGDGETITLRVAVQDRPAPRGVLLFLAGGPGQAGIPFAGRLAARLREAARGYRLVMLDQRGTGAGALRCDALQREVGTSDVAVPSEGAVRACAKALGAARDAYSTADTVADLEALRRALRAPTWTVGGISYGTFVAERLALAHPRTIKALVLDSVVPQAGAELLLRDSQRAVGRVLRAVCGARCVADLRRLLRVDGPLGPRVLDALVARSIGVPRFGDVGAVLRRAVTDDRGPLAAYLAASEREARGVPPRLYSTGLHAATFCADAPAPWPGGPSAAPAVRASAADAQQARMGPRATDPFPASTSFAQGFFVTCRAWPVTAAPPAPDPQARIAAPALLLAGDRDLSTPLEWARAQRAQMDHARLVTVPGAGHSILSRERGTRGRDALRAFLAER
jgi:pimeloyl-ACP methyl ester carboxylesterase